MKPMTMGSPIGLARLAAPDEVVRAISSLSQGAIEFTGPRDNSREMGSDSGGEACNFSEDDLWLALVSEMPDSKSN